MVFATQGEDPRAGALAWVRVGQPRWQLGVDSYPVGEPGGLRALLDAILARLFACSRALSGVEIRGRRT